jgi:Host cell surface-exposed lipoprotein
MARAITALTVALIALIGCAVEEDPVADAVATSSPAATTAPAVTEAPPPETEAPAEPEVTETAGQSNARRKAESYLSFSAFSRSGLIGQLEFEGFSTEDATYAVDAVGADWMAQAAEKAASYLSFSAFSRQGLIDQLLFEGFSPEEAEHGVTAVGL